MNSLCRGLLQGVGTRGPLLARSLGEVGLQDIGEELQSMLTMARVLSTKIKQGSILAEKEPIEQVRARIFGNHIGDGLRSGRKILARPLIGPKVASYYPPNWFAGDPLLLDLEAEKKKSKLSRLSRRGKSPPKKGAGKRSSKK